MAIPTLHTFLVISSVACAATAQVTLNHVGTVDLSSTANPANAQYIGSNPGAIAWDGTNLFVAGFNNSNAVGNVGITTVSNALTTPTFATSYGFIATPSFRGYSGLDLERTAGVLVAAYDDGTANTNGIAAYTAAGGQLWTATARGGSGIGIDPRFPVGSVTSGVAWTTFGSGRRAMQDLAGATVYTTSNGMVVLTPQGTFWRDMAFDPTNGDIWLREGNNVIKGVRTGDNSVGALTVPFDPADADTVNQQNIAFCRTPGGSIVVFNDRGSATPNQDFFLAQKAMRADGTMQSIDFGTFVPAGNGGANYDYSYDAASNTLVILDIFNRQAYVFDVIVPPYFPYGQGCPGSNSLVPVLGMSGAGTPASTISFDFTNGVASSAAFVLIGFAEANTPVFGSCSLLVTPVLPVTIGPAILDGLGAGSTAIGLPAGTSGIGLNFQGVVIDAFSPLGFALSNGMRLDIP
jgi:hypothetical protein